MGIVISHCNFVHIGSLSLAAMVMVLLEKMSRLHEEQLDIDIYLYEHFALRLQMMKENV